MSYFAVYMSSESSGLDFQISIEHHLDFILDQEFGTIGETMTIDRKISSNARMLDFTAVLKQGNLPFEKFDSQVIYPEITLGNKTFTDVISNERIDDFQSRRQMYYNNTGLIAFKDGDEKLWVRI